ncbi:M14 family zinc carboxypeptidase [Ideonella sp. YS5]|uniref:M14 family zinc carboxypeptidase n=1 Tax=Ideonella sp. YS5 TaxID=3453714 RepID=UPI003EE8FE75
MRDLTIARPMASSRRRKCRHMPTRTGQVFVQVEGAPSSVAKWLGKSTAELHGVQIRGEDLVGTALVPADLVANVARFGLKVLRSEPELARTAEALRAWVPSTNRFRNGQPPPSLGAGQSREGYEPYYNDEEFNEALVNLEATYPDQAQLIDLPHRTWQNRNVKALRLGRPSSKKPAIVMLGCMHADEWGGCEILLHLASDLLYSVVHDVPLNYGGLEISPLEVAQLLAERDLILVPVVNPDGRHATQTDPTRAGMRRNARPKNGLDFAAGVDLNRNFDFLFDVAEFDPAVAPWDLDDTDSGNYHGPSAASEPETKNIRALLDSYPARWLIDLHRPGLTIRHPWAVDESQATNSAMNFRQAGYRGRRGLRGDAYSEFMCSQDQALFERLASRFVADVVGAGGPQFSTSAWYVDRPMPGSCLDYAYARHLVDGQCGKTLSFLVEWDDNYNQPDPDRMTTVLGYAAAGLIGFSLETLR